MPFLLTTYSLTNSQEYQNGTNPIVADTDNDGMPDGWELSNSLNLLINDANTDADNDGLTNLQEYQNGTNPIVADTDNDGMPDGWEVNYSLNLLINDADGDGDNDGLTNLQEYQNGTNPILADTDGDGMPDGWEISNSLNPLLNNSSTDSDNDNLSDLQEYQNGTNPKTVDSDYDGMPDGYEVVCGLSPLDPNDATADADNDGYSNLREFLHSSQANDVNSLPTASILNVPQSCCSIQNAINLSIDGDTIKVARGRYYEAINFNGKAIKLTGSDPNDWYIVGTTVIDGNNNDANVVIFDSNEGNNSVLTGFTIDNGQNNGIVCGPNIPSSPTISKCIVKNSGSHGIYCLSGQPLIENSKLCFNSGYGIYSSSASFVLKNSHVYKNNQGGIRLNSSALASEIRNNTIAYNTSRGIYAYSGVDPVISNCIVWENSDDLVDCNAVYSCIQDNDSGIGNIYTNPKFLSSDVNECSLQRTSPCINAGDPNGNYQNEQDIENQTRLAKNADIGADEVCELHNIDKDIWYSYNDNQGIQTAINEANDFETIEVYQWTFYESINFSNKNLILTNPDYSLWSKVESTIIDANDPNVNVVTFSGGQDSNSIIRGITITGGNSGIYCSNSSSPKIIKCIIADNNSHGIYCQSGSPLINANKIRANKGDGVYSSSSVSPIVAFNWIYSNNNGLTVADANSALQSINNTIVYNKAYGVYHSSGVAPYINSCIVWGHDSNDLYDCNATYSCIQDVNDANGSNNYTDDPLFQNADSNNFHLAPNSPYIEGADHSIDRTGLIDIDSETPHTGPGADCILEYCVDGSVSLSGDGTTWAGAFKTLEEALAECRNAETKRYQILVAEGTYYPDSTLGRYATFQLIEDVAVYGGFPAGGNTTGETDPEAYPTILSGDIDGDGTDTDNCINVVTSANNAVLDGFTIKGGNANYLSYYVGYDAGNGFYSWIVEERIRGGGILCINNDITVTNCTFSSNKATLGGAIYFCNSNSKIENCTFKNNEANPIHNKYDIEDAIPAFGGAIDVEGDGSLNITKCIFKDNVTTGDDIWGGGVGGAIFINRGINSVRIDSSSFSGNYTEVDAISIWSGADNLVLLNTIFVNNYTDGVWDVVSDNVTATNCVFCCDNPNCAKDIVNTTKGYFTNCTFSGGLTELALSQGEIKNCIFYRTIPSNYRIIYTRYPTSVTISNSNVKGSGGSPDTGGTWNSAFGIDGGGNIDDNPKFVMFGTDGEDDNGGDDDLSSGVAGTDGIYGTNDDGLRLAVGSPCINAGTETTLTEDILGHQRVIGTSVDMGAYEACAVITASAGEHGSISPDGETILVYGEDKEFTATPDTGYEVYQWIVDSTVVQTGGTTYSFTNITDSHTITVSFKQLTYTITASAGSNGSITPSRSVSENHA